MSTTLYAPFHSNGMESPVDNVGLRVGRPGRGQNTRGALGSRRPVWHD